jgi:ubiquinone/menaquinone biosynthesis C-methylase UbiE
MQTNTTTTDGWFKRRMMRLTSMEKLAMNNARHSKQTERTALSLLEHANLGEKPYCLEIGCGQGALARLLVERFDARVLASDADPDQVALARRRTPDLDDQIEFRVIDARNLPFESQHFEAVFSFGVLHHIPGDWQKVVTEVNRVLKPGGWFIFTDFPLMPGPRNFSHA